MKIQIFSDLHADVAPPKPIAIEPSVDLVVVAGDTCQGAERAFETLRSIVATSQPIVMVMGNHEYYGTTFSDELALARELAPKFGIYLIENGATIFDEVRFVGATLWTDYAIFGAGSQKHTMEVCARGLNDHRLINWRKKPWSRFRPQEALRLHQESKSALTEILSTPFPGPSFVVSHHGVTPQSIDPRFEHERLTGAYVSDLTDLILETQPDFWLHGHTHRSNDYFVGKTRILSNPHGYGSENPVFDPSFVVEVGS